MDLDLRTLAIFVKVAERQSFARAAEALDMTPSGVSNAIKRLEGQLDTSLLARTTRSVHLTVDGEAFYHRCRQVLADLDEATQVLTRARRQPSGTLRVSLPVSFGRVKVVPLLSTFQSRFPKIDLAISTTDRYVHLVDEGIDVAVRFGPLDDSSLIARPLAPARRRVVATPAYLGRNPRPTALSELARHNCITLSHHETGRVRPWIFSEAGSPCRIVPAGSLTFNDGTALHAAVLSGIGLAQIHDYIVEDDLAAGRLVSVLDDVAPAPDPIAILYPQSRHLSPRVRAFVTFLAAACG